jgi:hypothetical protein
MSGRLGHLVRRFATTVAGRRPEPVDEKWVRSILSACEIQLWEQMTATDRAHGVEVARRTAESIDEPRVLAAALLHDVGKVEAEAGVMMRVLATLTDPLVSESREAEWATRSGPIGKLGRLLCYPQIGAMLLADAGSDRLVVQWAAEHHHPAHRWTVDPAVGAVLQAADDASS